MAAAAVITWAGRDVALIGDEWAWIFGGLHPDADTILQDYNGHLLATTWSGYYGLLVTFGLPEYWVYRVVALLLHLGVVVLVFLLARRRVGPWPAVAPTAAIAFLGTGSDVFLSGLNLGIAGAMVACLGALAMLDRRARRADLAACVLLLVGLASFSSAVAFTAGVYVEILWQGDRWRRIWVPLVPTVLYVAWWLIWGGSADLEETGNIVDVVGHGFQAAVGAIAGLGGVQLASPTLQEHFPWLDSLAQLTVVLGLVALVWFLVRRREVSARLANLIATGAVLWLMVALTRGSHGDLFASRYVYMGAVVVLLVVVELAPGLRLRGRAVARALVLAVGVTVALNVVWMVIWGHTLRRESATARAELAALDIAGGRAPSNFHPSRAFRLSPVTARDYFEAVREFGGSPALTTADLRRASEANREAADRVLVGALGLRIVPAAAPGRGRAPVVERSTAAAIVTAGSCLTVTPKSGVATLDFVPRSPAGVVLEIRPGGRLQLRARRFGDRFKVGVGELTGGSAILETPLGRASDPWHLRLISNAPTRVCARRPSRD